MRGQKFCVFPAVKMLRVKVCPRANGVSVHIKVKSLFPRPDLNGITSAKEKQPRPILRSRFNRLPFHPFLLVSAVISLGMPPKKPP